MKEFKIEVPEGYMIDEENSTFECIRFRPIEKKRFIDDRYITFNGYWITENSTIKFNSCSSNTEYNYNVFATGKQAKSALAMARISQIMANDRRFGGAITDEEWNDRIRDKYVINRKNNEICTESFCNFYHFLAFHTKEQCNLFLKENKDLIKYYLMID